MPCGATQQGQVMVEWSNRMWSTGEGNDKPLQYSCPENPVNSMKRQKRYDIERLTPQVSMANMLPEKSGEIVPERMKRLKQSENNTHIL